MTIFKTETKTVEIKLLKLVFAFSYLLLVNFWYPLHVCTVWIEILGIIGNLWNKRNFSNCLTHNQIMCALTYVII